jgi:hypothetical protein
VKNITVAVEDEVYRHARIVAAQRDTSVSALVKDYLAGLPAAVPAPSSEWKQIQEALLDAVHQRHPGFASAQNLSRDALHDRDDLH